MVSGHQHTLVLVLTGQDKRKTGGGRRERASERSGWMYRKCTLAGWEALFVLTLWICVRRV